MLLTGSTDLPVGDTNASIENPRAGRIEWPTIGAQVAYAVPVDPGVGWPAVVEIPRENLMRYPGRGAGLLGARHERWGVDLAPICKSPDSAGSCPLCFSHDDPNDPRRAAGPGPEVWWNKSPGFIATMVPLTPARVNSSGQVSLFHLFQLPTFPPPTTLLPLTIAFARYPSVS